MAKFGINDILNAKTKAAGNRRSEKNTRHREGDTKRFI